MDIKPLPQVPVLSNSVDKTSRNAFNDIHGRINQLITAVKAAASTVIAHATTHKAGGGDALTPADIGAASADHTHSASLYVPPGAVMSFAMSTPPDGWLECNGQAVSRTTYAALFAAIGTTFGAGDGATTFNLPDLRGEFIRGWDHGRGVDPGRAFGSWQADDYKSHLHYLKRRGNPDAGAYDPSDARRSESSAITSDRTDYGFIVPTSSTGGSETRPRNVALLYCIKY